MARARSILLQLLALSLILLATVQPTNAYSVLTHEELIDLTWTTSIRPLMQKRFPNITDAQLLEAHAYAYGGCVIQDLGYYPFGKPIFSDLLHYVRTGDFIRALFRDAQGPNDIAFAIGALSHYLGDTIGHPQVINISVGKEFPKLEAKYGPNVNYAEGEHQHVRVEFAFDINSIVQRRLAPERYLNHIGFAVPVPLLARAFYDTYGLDIAGILGSKHQPVMNGYHYSVRTLLPRVAYAETLLYRKHMPTEPTGPEIDQLNQDIAALAAASQWDSYRRHPGFGTHMLAGLIFIVPKVGPFNDLLLRGPTTATEDDYVKSLLKTTAALRHILETANQSTVLPNIDLDTGDVIAPGTYSLCDKTYADLLHMVTQTPSTPIPIAIKTDLEAFFVDPERARYLSPPQQAQVKTELAVLAKISTKAEYPESAFLPEPAAAMPQPSDPEPPQNPATTQQH